MTSQSARDASILVTGGSGTTGRLLIQALRAHGIRYRVLARSAGRRAELRRDDIPTIDGDFDRPETLAAALDGATAAYLVCTPDEQLARREISFIRAARAARLPRIVKCGAYGTAHDCPSPTLRLHAQVEDELRASGVAHTVLRPHGFMQSLYAMIGPFIAQHGTFMLPAGDGPIPLIDARDVAEAALTALLDPTFEGRSYDLTGPEALRLPRVAEILSRTLERPIRYVDASEAAFDAALRGLHLPDTAREHVLWTFREQRAGRFDFVARGHEALGIRPRPFAEFAADLRRGRTAASISDFRSSALI